MRHGLMGALRVGVAIAALTGIAVFTSPALAQSGCGPAMADFQAAMKANTAEAMAAYLDEHAPCLEGAARKRLEALGGAPGAAARYDGPEVRLTVLGSPSYMGPYVADAEARYWGQAVPTLGNVSVDLQPDYGGRGQFEYVQAVADGDADAALLYASTASALEGPFGTVLAGLNVPLAGSDAKSARSVQDAVRERIARAMSEAGLVLLGAAPTNPGLLVCNAPINRLDDIRGKAVRFFGRDYLIDALGGEGKFIGFSDVLPALERGVIDCALTDASAHYRLGTHRTGGYVTRATLLDWGMTALVMNADAFNALPEPVRTGLLDAARAGFEQPVWSGVEASIAADIGCMTGRGACPAGVQPGNLTAGDPLPYDATAKRLLSEVVLPQWAETAPAALVDGWRADASTAIDIAR